MNNGSKGDKRYNKDPSSKPQTTEKGGNEISSGNGINLRGVEAETAHVKEPKGDGL